MLALIITSYYLLPSKLTFVVTFGRYINKQGFVRNETRTNERMKVTLILL